MSTPHPGPGLAKLTGILALLAAAASGGGAQTFGSATGAVEGRVVDAEGVRVAGAEVRVASVDGSVRRDHLTDAHGVYWSGGLPSGMYSIEAFKEGYASAVVEQIILDAGEVLRYDFTLERGQATTFSLTSAPVLDTVLPAAAGFLDPAAAAAGPWHGRLGAAVGELGFVEEPPAGLGARRLGMAGGWPSRAAVAVDGHDIELAGDALWVEAADLFFARVQARRALPSPARSAAPGGWIDLVTSVLPVRPLAGTVRWSAADADLRALSPCASTGCVLEGGSQLGGMALGGSLASERLWLFASGARERRRDSERDLELTRDAAAARLRWSAGGRWSAGASLLSADSALASGNGAAERGAVRDHSELVTATADRAGSFWALHADLGELERRQESAARRWTLGLAGIVRLHGAGEHSLDLGARRAHTEWAPSASRRLESLWASDRWRLGRRLSLTLGARYETSRLAWAGIQLEEARLAPFFGIALDVYGDGTWKVFARYARAFVDGAPELWSHSLSPPPGALDHSGERPEMVEATLGSEQIVLAGVRLHGRLSVWRLDGAEPRLHAAPVEGRSATVGAAVDLFRRWSAFGSLGYSEIDGAGCEPPPCSGLATLAALPLERPYFAELRGTYRFGRGVDGGFGATWMAAARSREGTGEPPSEAYVRFDLSLGSEWELGSRPLVLGAQLALVNVSDRRAAVGVPAFGASASTRSRQEPRGVRFDLRLSF